MQKLKVDLKFLFSILTCLTILLSCATNTNSSGYWFQFILLVGIFGLITGLIANSKGHSFITWFLFGSMLFIVALPMVLFLKPTADNLTTKKCPQCAEIINKEALVCRFCQYKFTDNNKLIVETENKISENQNENIEIDNKYFCQKCGEECYLDKDELINKKFSCPICKFEQLII